ncbi:LysR family transcriptional regulator ArgP [Corynebacterium nasicanis]|uniref:LysR family transcriptional regulator ArgP n=1 Tax=Corynebacterium nasicanis TaxID=1448267 RepID=A0ABW1QCI3_9CORY
MNPLHLESLLVIVDEGSFEAAAHSLGVTPSAVSQRIKALEKDIGRVLVRRSSPATATEAGEILVQAARRMRLLQAETDARLEGRLGRVPLSIAVNADSLATWFTPVMSDVAAFEGATLRVRVEDEARTLVLLRRGDVLGAVTREPRPVSGCESLPLGVVRYRAVATPELAARYPGPDWSQMPTLRFGPGDSLQAADLEERLGPRQRPRMSEIPSSEALARATLCGLGWGLMSELQADAHLRRGDLVTLDERIVEVPLHWQRWRLESELLEKLTDSVLAAAQQLPAV